MEIRGTRLHAFIVQVFPPLFDSLWSPPYLPQPYCFAGHFERKGKLNFVLILFQQSSYAIFLHFVYSRLGYLNWPGCDLQYLLPRFLSQVILTFNKLTFVCCFRRSRMLGSNQLHCLESECPMEEDSPKPNITVWRALVLRWRRSLNIYRVFTQYQNSNIIW